MFFPLKSPSWFKDLSGAWVFYSILPKLPFTKPNLNRIARFAPLIGIIIGILQSLIWLGLNEMGWSNEAKILCVVAFAAWITGGLHIDGLIDTADGIAAGKEKCLIAMRDSTIGASGINLLMIIILIQVATLIEINIYIPIALIISNFWGRVSPLIAIDSYSYLHKEGTGLNHKKGWKGLSREMIPSILIIFTLFIAMHLTILDSTLKNQTLIVFIFSALSALTVPHLLSKKLNGYSGDSLGASVILTETCSLIISSFVFR